jgi:RNA polymerase sigma-70 factor (ECF subfamily)
MPRDGQPVHEAAERVARNGYGKLVAFLAARTRDVAAAEDALADAFAAALTNWTANGIPRNPEAWLIAVARRKAIDAGRRKRNSENAVPDLRMISEELAEAADADMPIQDERLSLMFACAHPAIDPGIRAPLILQTVLGFDAATIASAFLLSPATMSQRLVRAKTKIRQAGVPFRVPERSHLGERLAAVLDSIYAAFTEGWCDAGGTDVRRRDLAEETIWLGRMVAALMPDEPEALGLLALMLYAEARRGARRNERGEYIPLEDQDVSLWDDAMIDEAESLLLHASNKGDTGRYQLEAAVQSAHVVRRRSGRSDWPAIERIYDVLVALTGSPVVAINRAIAIAEARGAGEGLAALDELAGDRRLTEYQPYWAVRAGLLAKAGQIDLADQAYEQAIGLESDPAVRGFLQQRRTELKGSSSH